MSRNYDFHDCPYRKRLIINVYIEINARLFLATESTLNLKTRAEEEYQVHVVIPAHAVTCIKRSPFLVLS
jgi:hypothetical protein